MARDTKARRLDESVREKLAAILTEEISDPRLDLITVTGVRVTSDSSYADVYVIAHGDEERYREVLEGLESAKGRIRSLLARSIRTRTVPELRFHIDESVDQGERIDDALKYVPPTLAEERAAEAQAALEAAEEAAAEAAATLKAVESNSPDVEGADE